jgi:hypothetical protein
METGQSYGPTIEIRWSYPREVNVQQMAAASPLDNAHTVFENRALYEVPSEWMVQSNALVPIHFEQLDYADCPEPGIVVGMNWFKNHKWRQAHKRQGEE